MQSISPETIYRGIYAWEESLPQITKLTKSPLILGRGIHTKNLRNNISIDLKNQNLRAVMRLLEDSLAEEVLSGRIKDGDNALVDIDDNKKVTINICSEESSQELAGANF